MEKRFENLKVWQKSKDLIINVYKVINEFPEYEKYAMTGQMRRAVNSICANIAEGTGRKSDKELINFLYIARGSLEETKSFLIISYELNYITNAQLEDLLLKSETIGRMLSGLIKSIKNNTR